MTRDTYGQLSRTPFARYDPDGCCWRTSQVTFPWDSGTFSGTWPAWGMTRAGESYELPTPAHLTAGRAYSSLLPTPLASDGEHGGPNQRGGKGDLRLTSAVLLLPTPVADSRGLAQTGTDYQSLPNVVLLLPTPKASDQIVMTPAADLRRNSLGLRALPAILAGARGARQSNAGPQSWDVPLPLHMTDDASAPTSPSG